MKIKILFSAFLLTAFIACDDLTDEVVNSPNSEYNVSEITAPANVEFDAADSSLVASLKIDNPDVVAQVWYNVVTTNASETIVNNVVMFDNGDNQNYGDQNAGDNVFSGKTYFGESKPSGKYLLQFFVQDNVNNEDENTRIVGVHQFVFDNGKNKIAPVLSDLVMPDSVRRGEEFVFTVKVTDQNGLNDIDKVYFTFTRPNGTASGSILMVDDGDSNLGDETEGDGIFSFKNSFSDGTPLPDGSPNPAAQLGEWTFRFKAEDRGGLVSNEITHIILVKE